MTLQSKHKVLVQLKPRGGPPVATAGLGLVSTVCLRKDPMAITASSSSSPRDPGKQLCAQLRGVNGNRILWHFLQKCSSECKPALSSLPSYKVLENIYTCSFTARIQATVSSPIAFLVMEVFHCFKPCSSPCNLPSAIMHHLTLF